MNAAETVPGLEVERSLLGALLIGGEPLVARVKGLAEAEDFAGAAHAFIYDAIQTLAARGEPVDLVTVPAELEKTAHLSAAGGATYICGLVDRVPDIESAPAYARLVRESAVKRGGVALGKKMAAAFNNGRPSREIFAEVSAQVRELESRLGGGTEVKTFWIDPGVFRGELRKIAETRRPTSLPTIDRATDGGFSGDTVILLVGPIGSCKTSLAFDQAIRRAKETGGKVYAYCPDQGGGQPLRRLAGTFGDIVGDEAAFQRFLASVDPYLRIVDERESGVTIEAFRDAVLASGNVAAAIIDTPQTVATAEDDEERQRINAAMDIARELASKLIIPVFVCSHANRASTAARKKEDRTLGRSAGLGSAGLEHRAQIVLFMERVEKEKIATVIDVSLEKVTFGRAGGHLRLVLEPESWGMREIDFVEEEETKKASAATENDQKKATASADRRIAILKVVRGASDPAVGVSWARIRDAWKGRTEDLGPTLAVLVEEKRLDAYLGAKPLTGGRRPTFYRLGLTEKGAALQEPFPFVRKGDAP